MSKIRGVKWQFYALFSILMLISGGVGFSATGSGTTVLMPESTVVYNQLQLASAGLNADVFDKAYNGWQKLQQGTCKNKLLSIADFSQSSNAKRLYIIDVENRKVLFQTYVAHGRNSGEEFAASFSNQAASYK